MDDQAFKAAYNESRNGSNQMYHHNLVPPFRYTDGVRDCAMAGCYWVLDVVATEGRAAMIERAKVAEDHALSPHTLVAFSAKGWVEFRLEGYDDDGNWVTVWRRAPALADLTEGEWRFDFGALNVPSGNCQGLIVLLSLPSED